MKKNQSSLQRLVVFLHIGFFLYLGALVVLWYYFGFLWSSALFAVGGPLLYLIARKKLGKDKSAELLFYAVVAFGYFLVTAAIVYVWFYNGNITLMVIIAIFGYSGVSALIPKTIHTGTIVMKIPDKKADQLLISMNSIRTDEKNIFRETFYIEKGFFDRLNEGDQISFTLKSLLIPGAYGGKMGMFVELA